MHNTEENSIMYKEAVIFDMDGVISDTQKLHSAAESKLLSDRLNISIPPEEITRRFAGVSDSVMMKEILAENNISFNPQVVEQIITKKWDVMYAITKETPIEPIPYALELIHHLKESNFKLDRFSFQSHLHWVCSR
jgi:beta-phosphoglucomutase-like phosphatase (HAD superfamily)